MEGIYVWSYFWEISCGAENDFSGDAGRGSGCTEKGEVKLGLIAVSEKLLTQEQADKINRKQALEDKRFGDIAVEMGYLTESQVSRLLQLQGNPI